MILGNKPTLLKNLFFGVDWKWFSPKTVLVSAPSFYNCDVPYLAIVSAEVVTSQSRLQHLQSAWITNDSSTFSQQIFPNSDTTKGPEPEDDPDAEQKERARLERQRMGGTWGSLNYPIWGISLCVEAYLFSLPEKTRKSITVVQAATCGSCMVIRRMWSAFWWLTAVGQCEWRCGDNWRRKSIQN